MKSALSYFTVFCFIDKNVTRVIRFSPLYFYIEDDIMINVEEFEVVIKSCNEPSTDLLYIKI